MHSAAHIARILRDTREAKGLSQRDLSQRAGVPQPHISKIENEAVDLRLSSLLAIANALDLELALVPRKAVPAVQSIARMTSESDRADPEASTELARTLNALTRLRSRLDLEDPRLQSELDRLQAALTDLGQLPLTAAHATQLRRLRRQFLESDKLLIQFDAAIMQIRDMRSRLLAQRMTAGDATASPRPAYSLDEDDDG